jgi:hypothetical protein
VANLEETEAGKKAVLAEVESQQGKPFKYEAKLAQARVMCAELDGKLKASIEPAKQAQPETPETADGLDPALARLRKLHAASFPTPPRRDTSGRPRPSCA